MRKSFGYGLAIGALLLVGAGCAPAAKESEIMDTEVKQESAADMKASDPATSVDASVDAIISAAETEKTIQSDSDKSADDAVSDTAELNSFMQADYDLK